MNKSDHAEKKKEKETIELYYATRKVLTLLVTVWDVATLTREYRYTNQIMYYTHVNIDAHEP